MIKYLKVYEDKEALRRLLETDEEFQEVLVDTGRVIRAVTGASFRIPRKKETMNMCKAERELCEEAEKIGETRGEEKGRKKGRKEGRKEGEKRGILAYVSRLLRMNVSKEDLLDALCEDFRLSRKKAMTYLQ